MTKEEALVRAFVVKAKEARLIQLLASAKRRKDATSTFDHFHGLDPRLIVRLPPNERFTESIARALALRGAGDTCHVISADPEFDARRMPLEEALHQVVGLGRGTFLSCVPGMLAYFEDEDRRCILWKHAV